MSSKYISIARAYNLSPGEVLAGLVFGVLGTGRSTDTLEHLDKKAVEYGMSMFIMDKITETHTGFSNFKELLNAKGYRPTIRCNDTKVYKGDVAVDMTLLADAYDMVQTLRGDDRRVFGRG